MSNIGVFVRTRNEAKHIQQFIHSHSFADTIYIADGGSTDNTLLIASRYPNVKVREFNERVYNEDGTWFSHESRHYQFLNEWSQEEGVDWAVFDDADHICNHALNLDARQLLEANQTPYAYALLMYVWGGYDSKVYFPELNKCCPTERLWAWKPKEWTPKINLVAAKTLEIVNQPDAQLTDASIIPHPPYCVRHYSYLTEESIREKMAFNARRGVLQVYPLESCGKLERLPDWAF